MSLGGGVFGPILLHIIYCALSFSLPMVKGVFPKLRSDETQADYPAFTAMNFTPKFDFTPQKK